MVNGTLQQSENLPGFGAAIQELGLANEFLANGELQNYRLIERGQIANSVISKKLEMGDWKTVIRMMYGDFGKAEALYEGNRDELEDKIVKSAEQYPHRCISDEVNALEQSGSRGLLFRLATTLPLNYDDFTEILCHDNTWDFIRQDSSRKKTFYQLAAEKALKEGKIHEAFDHFKRNGDKQGIEIIFEQAISDDAHHSIYDSMRWVVDTALEDPEKKQERLKRVITRFSSERPLQCFQLYQDHNVDLESTELKKLRDNVTENAEEYHFGSDRELKDADLELKLAWAKKHADDNPKAAYRIFCQQDYQGTQLMRSVIAGLQMERHNNEHRSLSFRGINEDHLEIAYGIAPFGLRVSIAYHQQDSKRLKQLSKESSPENRNQAYRMWFDAFGDPDDSHIQRLRIEIIEEGVESGFISLHHSDQKGNELAYKAVIDSNPKDVRWAYKFATDSGNISLVQRAREEFIKLYPARAIETFQSAQDSVGVDYAIKVIAEKHNTNQGQLRNLVEKYASV